MCRLYARVNVTCDRDYYGPQCDEYCVARDNCTGHYTCNQVTGAPECLPGWTEASNCTVAETSGEFCPTSVPYQPPFTGDEFLCVSFIIHVTVSKVKWIIYIAVHAIKIAAERYYNTLLVHWTHDWLPYKRRVNMKALCSLCSTGTRLYCLMNRGTLL